MIRTLLVLQTLTNLFQARPGPGLPDAWSLTRLRRASPPAFQVNAAHTLRIEANGQAGFATYRLRRPMRPGERAGSLSWRWRTGTPLRGAALRARGRDDSPALVVVAFDDGRTLAYTWGNAEPLGDVFRSATSALRGVVICRRAEDANGSWFLESHDPFADYRRAFNRASHPIVAVGVGADADRLYGHTIAEVSELTWE